MDHKRWLIWIIAFILLALMPLLLKSYTLYTWSLAGVYVIAALGLNLLTGYAGQISLGHAGLMAIGAYTAGLVSTQLGWPFWLNVPAAGLVTGVVGLILVIPALRLTEIYLAIATLGFGVAVTQLIPYWGAFTGGYQGLRVPKMSLTGADSDVERYLLVLLAVLLMVALAYNLVRSSLGRAWIALRDRELAAQALGIHPPTLKAYAFAVSACFTGISGGLYAHLVGYITPDDFSLALSITLFAMIVVGGLASIPGAILGAAFLAMLPHWLSGTRELSQVIYGAALVAVVIFMPHGIWGTGLSLYYRAKLSGIGVAAGRLAARLPIVRRAAVPGGGGTLSPGSPAAVPVAQQGPQLNQSLLALERVTMRFGGLKAVDDVSFSVRKGEIVGLVGPNGAGKTTLFNLISRFYTPVTGQILLAGRDLLKLGPHQIIGQGAVRTFQNIGLFPYMSVLDNLMVGQHERFRGGILAEASGLPQARREERQLRSRAEALLTSFNLSTIKNVYVSSLPYGTQKLIELIRALLAEPRLLLLDEPVAGMTQQEREQMAQLVRKARDEYGVTVLLVEHDMSFVMGICDRVIVLSFGKVIAEGKPDEVSRNPAVIEAYLGEEITVA